MARLRERVRLELGSDAWLQGEWSGEANDGQIAVVFAHGFGSVRYGEKAAAIEEACARRGWAFAAFDFRGHGESSGTMLELRGSTLLADLERIAAFLSERGFPRLALVGSSMGGWAAAWYSLTHPVVAMALIAPGFHFPTARWDRLDDAGREAWKRTGRIHLKLDWVETDLGYGLVEEAPLFPRERLMREMRTPALVFQGMNDPIVPPERTFDWVRQSANPHLELRVYKDGDHRLVERKTEMAEAACGFFERRLVGV